MKIAYRIGLVGLLVAGLTINLLGCDESGRVTNEGVGQITGGVLGGILGSQVRGSGRTAATIGGVLLGGYLGGTVGRQMGRNDRAHFAHSLEYDPANRASYWNDSYGRRRSITPSRPYIDSYRRRCRRFVTTVFINGRYERARGRACRASDGRWYIVQ